MQAPESPSTHRCPAKDCEKIVPVELLACKPHWFTLPKELRKGITDSWQEGRLAWWAALRKQALEQLQK